MKLLKLEILNLASLDRPDGEVINFEEGSLKDSTIFSIVGSTGSGKSTILDAICLALYNRAPRYPRQKGKRNQKIEVYGDPDENEKNRLAPSDCRNILTRGTKHGYSKLTFLTNKGDVYRAEWSVRFKTKNFEDVITSLYLITNVNGNAVETEKDWEELPDIIGLDYDQFLRTVLIAQGTFSNFLNAKEDERYLLLEKLIGNEDLYAAIAASIKEKKDTVDEDYNTITASVAAYEKDLISDKDELEALAERIKELENSDKADKEELQHIAEALAWYLSDQKYNENIAKYQENYDSAKKRLEEHKEAAERLLMHDSTLPAVDLYKDILAANTEIVNGESNLTTLKDQLTASDKNLEEKQVEHNSLKVKAEQEKEEQEKQKPHIAKARLLMGELAVLENAAKALDEGYKTAVKATNEASKAVKDNEDAIVIKNNSMLEKQSDHDTLKAAIDNKTTELEAALKVAEDKYEGENKKIEGLDPEQLQSAKSAADNELADLREAVRVTKELQEKRSQSAAKLKEKTDLQNKNLEIEKELSLLTIDKLSAELEVMTKSYTLMTSESWDMHRKDLRDGEACPLCGSTHHPYKNDENLEPVVSELGALINDKKAELEKQESSKSELEAARSANVGRIEACNEAITNLANAISEFEVSWTNLKNRHDDWEQNLESLETAIQATQDRCTEAELRLGEYNSLTKKVNSARTDMDTAKKALDNHKDTSAKKLTEAQNAFTNAQVEYREECAKTETLSAHLKAKKEEQAKAEDALQQGKTQVDAKKHALKTEIGDKNPDKFEKELNDAVKTAQEKVEKAAEAIGKLRESKKELEGRIQIATDNRNKAQERLQIKTEELNAWLNQYNSQEGVTALNVEAVAGFHSSTEDWEGIRTEQKKLDTEYTRCHTTLENEKTARQTHQQGKPEKTEEELSARKAELAAKSNAELVESTARMQRHIAAKDAVGSLYDELEKAEQRKQDWKEINDAIGGEGKTLRKIAQCYTLRFLIEHANVELRKFRSRFELVQVKNSLGIRVIDHDRADDIRDTTSLSGGETFIVSLGLALGLSALSSRNISFENLFIDEGFGTLDPETLATVIDSLAMLQSSQGKKVGVISHTDTMAERITTQIRIIKNGNSGSSRIEVWP